MSGTFFCVRVLEGFGEALPISRRVRPSLDSESGKPFEKVPQLFLDLRIDQLAIRIEDAGCAGNHEAAL